MEESRLLQCPAVAQVNADRVMRKGNLFMGSIPRKAVAGIKPSRSFIFTQDKNIDIGKAGYLQTPASLFQ